MTILEAPADAVRDAMTEATGQPDHRAAFEHLLPKAKIISAMHGETKGGQRTRQEQGEVRDSIADIAVSGDRQAQYHLEQLPGGTVLELDPVIGADGRTIDLNFSLEHHPVPSVSRWQPINARVGSRIEIQYRDQSMAKTQTATTLLDGGVKLLGIWEKRSSGEAAPAPPVLQAAFLRAGLVRVLPLPSQRPEQILKERGEAVVPTPKGVRPVADPAMPPGMTVRRFRIPPDFLASSGAPGAAAAADPFASGVAPASEPQFMRRVTAEEILRARGIPFPDGASANFLPETNELVVRNTPTNLDLVADYVKDLQQQGPKTVQFSLAIVQGSSELIRRLEAESMQSPDHSPAWKAVREAVSQGQAKIINSAWLETKGGQRATCENVVNHFYPTDITKQSAKIAIDTSADAKDAAAAKAVPVVAEGGQGVVGDVKSVGVTFEVDPVVGPDGETIDLDYNFTYDFAPPSAQVVDEAPGAGERYAAPLTEFHRATHQSATTMLSGSTRLLSVWKPSGTAELDGDVLQAAFLQATVVKLEDSGAK